MRVEPPADLRAEDLRIGIVVSRYHHEITEGMLRGAVETFARAGGDPDTPVIVGAPGAFELPILSRALASRPDIDGVVALGCVVRGETTHDQHIAAAVAQGLTRIALDTGKPVAFGVLTCQTLHQARERSGGGRGNKGSEAMAAVIEAVHTVRSLAPPTPAPPTPVPPTPVPPTQAASTHAPQVPAATPAHNATHTRAGAKGRS